MLSIRQTKFLNRYKRGFCSMISTIKLGKTEDLVVGLPASIAISQYVDKYNYNKILLIASKTLDTTTNEINKIEDILGNRLSYKLTGISQHNPCNDQFNSIKIAREYNVDCVIMVGGGSVTDNGKAAALLKNEPSNLLYDSSQLIHYTPVINPEKDKKLPTALNYDIANIKPPTIVSVPTTLGGTSNLVGFVSQVTNKKERLLHDELYPKCFILDPDLVLHTPKWLWLSTGIRTIDHCITIIQSKYANIYWKDIAINSLTCLLANLSNIESREARLKCLISIYNMQNCITQGCPLGATHGIGLPLGTMFHVPNGYTSCVLIPAVLNWNILNAKNDETIQQNQDIIRNIFTDVFKYNNNFNRNDSASIMAYNYIKSLELPSSLNDVSVTENDFDILSEHGMKAVWCKFNCVPVTTKKQVLDILRMATN